jgi:hypothetical protein
MIIIEIMIRIKRGPRLGVLEIDFSLLELKVAEMSIPSEIRRGKGVERW